MTEKIKHSFSRAAKAYDEHCHLQLSVGTKLVNLLKQYLIQEARIIDLGCGTGLVTEKLASLNMHQSFCAIDFSKEMVETAKKRLSPLNISVEHENFDCLPQYPELFDLIFSNMSLHWSRDIKKTLRSSVMQLSEGGILAFSLPLSGTLDELKPYFSVNTFPTMAILKEILQEARCEILSDHAEQMILSFQDTQHALKSIKNIGSNAMVEREVKGLSRRSAMHQVNLQKLTYDIGYIVAKR